MHYSRTARHGCYGLPVHSCYLLWKQNGWIKRDLYITLKPKRRPHLQTAFLWLESLLGIIFTPLDFSSIAFFTVGTDRSEVTS